MLVLKKHSLLRVRLLRNCLLNKITVRNMSCECGESGSTEQRLFQAVKYIIPKLTAGMYKGQAGRIGIIGGSVEYTGAPYFAAISCLRVGCDLSHVFCLKEAAPIIKSYSPELIVHPFLDSPDALKLIQSWLPRLHVLVIGPGLGRDPIIFENVKRIINLCRNEEFQKPLIIDADGLFLLTENPEIIKDYPAGAILTPNAIEFTRLAKSVLGESWDPSPNPNVENVKSLASALGKNIVIVHKGAADVIAHGSSGCVWYCKGGGSARRCGGQGDLLSGSLGTFYAWALTAVKRENRYGSLATFPVGVIAAYAGCRLTRECNNLAFAKAGRSMLTSDMISEIPIAFAYLFENEGP